MEGGSGVAVISLVVPTLNAGGNLRPLLEALLAQSRPPEEILVVDSSSEDGTAAVAAAYGRAAPRIRLLSVPRGAFNHGGTRDMALRQTTGEYVLFLTQDALPADGHTVEQLLLPFWDARVAAVCGRQIARPGATPQEALIRSFNYPAESRVWGAEAVAERGIKAFFFSDVCAAYRREAYLAVGGFDREIPTNEDMLIAAKFLGAGWKLAYTADGAVYHSHRDSPAQAYRRHRLIGHTLQTHRARLQGAASTGEGLRLVGHVLAGLLRQGNFGAMAAFCLNAAARQAGYLAGRRAAKRGRR